MAETNPNSGEEIVTGPILYIGAVALPPDAYTISLAVNHELFPAAHEALGRLMTEGSELVVTIGLRQPATKAPGQIQEEGKENLPFEIITGEDNKETPVISHTTLANFLHSTRRYAGYPAARGVATALWNRLGELAQGWVSRTEALHSEQLAATLQRHAIMTPKGDLRYIPVATFSAFLDAARDRLGPRESKNLTMLLDRLQELDNAYDGN
jgi:hypothetical protein